MSLQTYGPPPTAPAHAPVWLSVLRGGLAAGASIALGIGGPYALGVLAFVLLPTCTRGDSPPALVAVTLGCLACAALVPVALAGLRLWWVGVPAAALALHGLLPSAWPLLTQSQSGFCF